MFDFCEIGLSLNSYMTNLLKFDINYIRLYGIMAIKCIASDGGNLVAEE